MLVRQSLWWEAIHAHPLHTTADWLLQPVYITGQIVLNQFASIQFDYRGNAYTSGAESNQFNLGLISGTAFTRVVHI